MILAYTVYCTAEQAESIASEVGDTPGPPLAVELLIAPVMVDTD